MARILVVDDEVGIRELLSEILYDEGHTVELAENAAEARAARLRTRPDLVLLDIWMPDTDGVSLLMEWGSQGLLDMRSEEHTSALQSLMRISYAVFCLQKK